MNVTKNKVKSQNIKKRKRTSIRDYFPATKSLNKTNRESLVDLKPLYSHIAEDMRKKADESKSLRDKIWSLINASIYHKRKNESKKTTKKKPVQSL